METAYVTLRTELKTQIEKCVAIRAEITSLCWKPGSEEAVRAIRAQRDSSGSKVSGRKALKPYRRPETGQVRYHLWYDKRDAGQRTRDLMLAYGLLRGTPYKSIEQKCKEGNAPYSGSIAAILARHGLPITASQVKSWLEGGPAPVWKQEAAA